MWVRVQQSFFRLGWLTPVILPLAEIGGRGLFNTLAVVYVLWGMLAVGNRFPRMDRVLALAYGGLIVGFLVSAIAAADPVTVLKDWGRWLLQALAFVLTLAALQQTADNLKRLIAAFGLAALITLVVLYLLLPGQVAQADFDPARFLKEDNLPFLAPFLMYWIWNHTAGIWQRLGMAAAGLLILAYVLGSQGRAAFLGLLVAALAGAWLLKERGRWKIVLLVLVLAGVGVGLGLDRFTRGSLQDAGVGWEQVLDRFSSNRFSIWSRAIEQPPASVWTGIGLGQVKRTATADELKPFAASHFHNFLLDCWYETGFVGLAGMLVFLLLMLRRGWYAWRCASGEARYQAVLLLAAALAIITSALLSFSYTSRQFSLYLLVLFAGMHHLYRSGGK